MAYDEQLANHIREALEDIHHVTEKKMFSGIAFMVNDKMCACATSKGLMGRVGFAKQQQLAEQPGYSEVVMRGKLMKDYIYMLPEAYKSKKHFDVLMQYCLAFNNEAKSSKKKK